jgi:hypothetical protein
VERLDGAVDRLRAGGVLLERVPATAEVAR